MDALEQNNRSFMQTTIIMIVIAGILIMAGVILFPLSLYDNPNSSLFGLPVLFDTPQGNLVIFALFGLLAANMAVFLARITRLEQQRNAILAQSANAAHSAQIPGRNNPTLPSAQ